MPKFSTLTCVAVLAVVAALLTTGATAPAQAAKPRLSLAAPTTATACTKVTVRGTLKTSATGLTLTLQRKSGSRWSTVQRTKQGKRKKFAFAVKVVAGAQVYRVVSAKTRRVSASTSPAVRIKGVARSSTPSTGGTTAVDRARTTILAATNAYRAAKCLRPLAVHGGLTAIAQGWAATMAARSSMVHNTRLASLVPGAWRRIGENIGMGYSITQITPAWWASPGHKANLLGDFTHIGIGYVVDAEGTGWYVQDFAKY